MTIYKKPLSPIRREAIPLAIIGMAMSIAALAADLSANALPLGAISPISVPRRFFYKAMALRADPANGMPLIRNFLEAHQIFIYICAVVLAGGVALLVSAASVLEAAVNPALALMLYVTFLQVPVAELRGGFGQGLS